MPIKNKKSLAIIIVIITIIFIAQNKSQTSDVALAYDLYDTNGNPIDGREASLSRGATINGISGISSIGFRATIKNSGDLPLQNIKVSSAYPNEVINAFSGTTVATLGSGQSAELKSAIIPANSFVGSSVPFVVDISGDYIDAQGSKKTITKKTAISLYIESDNKRQTDFRNLYGISWVGTACDNLAYAKTMGYDYVVYQSGMKSCPIEDKRNMHFYLPDPESGAFSDHYAWQIDTTKTYTQSQINSYNSVYVWKANSTNLPFPDNLGTGWWNTKTTFRPNADYQQQRVINIAVADALDKIRSYEEPSINFTFGGYDWDVPDLKGDWWTGRQNTTGHPDCLTGIPCTGKIVSLAYWNQNNIESSGLHDNITHEYSTYTEGRAALYKTLFSETRKLYPDMKIYYQPYGMYGHISTIASRSDKLELMPPQQVYYCQESATSFSNDINFLTDSRIYATGLITKDYTCNDNPDNQDVDRSLVLAGNIAINGAWEGFFGRFGGTHGAIAYTSIRLVPDRLKLIRIIATWDNMNKISLSQRNWNPTTRVYSSPTSYADMNIIYSLHPDKKMYYVVVLNKDLGSFKIPSGQQLMAIFNLDDMMKETTYAAEDWQQTGDRLYLKDTVNQEKAYVIYTR